MGGGRGVLGWAEIDTGNGGGVQLGNSKGSRTGGGVCVAWMFAAAGHLAKPGQRFSSGARARGTKKRSTADEARQNLGPGGSFRGAISGRRGDVPGRYWHQREALARGGETVLLVRTDRSRRLQQTDLLVCCSSSCIKKIFVTKGQPLRRIPHFRRVQHENLFMPLPSKVPARLPLPSSP